MRFLIKLLSVVISLIDSLPPRKRRANYAPHVGLASALCPSKRLCRAAPAVTEGMCEGDTSEHVGGGGQETCGWTGKVGALVEHLMECRFAATKCTLAGCNAKVQRKDVSAHEAECVWRGGGCERCGFAFTPGEPWVMTHPNHPGPFPVSCKRECPICRTISASGRRNLTRSPWFLSQEHECGRLQTLARQTIPRLKLLKGTVQEVTESAGSLQREVT